VAVLLVDSYLPFSVAQLVVPGLSSYRPLPTALGVVGAELLLGLALTNRFRARIPYAFWRRAHYLNFAVWALALAHGVTAGADGDTVWALALYAGCGSAVAAASVWRALRARPVPDWALALWTGTAGLVGAELVAALVLGPVGPR
jgi:predicted ferric reductase